MQGMLVDEEHLGHGAGAELCPVGRNKGGRGAAMGRELLELRGDQRVGNWFGGRGHLKEEALLREKIFDYALVKDT